MITGKMSYRDELFAKIGADDASKTPSQLLQEGLTEQQNGNVAKATNLYQQAFELSLQKAEETAQQKQHRNAAHLYYTAALAAENLQQAEKGKEMFQKVAHHLLLAGDNYFDVYSEFKQGVICAAFSGLTYLLIEDKDSAQKVYENYIAKINQKNESGDIPANAQKLLQAMWPVGYIIQALNETNHQALQDAQKYISTDIRPSLGEAKLLPLEPILDALLNQTLKKFEALIKLPEIQIATQVSNDLVLNQIFEISVNFSNVGEGVAYAGIITFEADENLEIVDGKLTHEFTELAPEATIDLTFHYRYQSANSEDVDSFFKGLLKYKDMLNNNHQQYIGPMKLHIAAVSKTERFGKLISAAKESEDSLSNVESKLPEPIKTSLLAIETSYLDSLAKALEQEEFSVIPIGIDLLADYRKSVTELLTGEPANAVQQYYEQEKEAYATEKVTETTEQLNAEKETALKNLSDELASAHQQALESLEQKLNEQHAQELSELKKKHEDEIKMLESKLDRQLEMKLKEQETELLHEHNAKLQELNDRNEKGLNEIRTELQKDFDAQLMNAKQECSDKYEAQITELKQSYEESHRQEIERLQEDHKLRIEQMTAEFEKEKQTIIDNYSNQAQ